MQLKSRIYGLDTLRSAAIILVFMFHYMIYVSHTDTFGFLSVIGWVGVDLFFVLSGYLIGHQLFAPIADQGTFSLKYFYARRLLRTLPNYLIILAIYYFIPVFRECEVMPPLWKFLTFTQNFGLKAGTAYSHAWSLCIEEQFYFTLPLLTLVVAYFKSLRMAWLLVIGIITAGVILRSVLWLEYVQNAGESLIPVYRTKIYFATFCRLDALTLGVAIAMLRDFYQPLWTKISEYGNVILLCGMVGTTLTFWMLLGDTFGLLSTAVGFPLLALCFAALTISALSPASYLNKIRIPGAERLAVLSYAIYLVHKPLMVMSDSALASLQLNLLTIVVSTIVTVLGGWLLYTCVESPFLRLREKLPRPDRWLGKQVASIV